MNQLSIITQMFEKLSDTEKSDFLEYLKGKPSKETKTFASFDELILKHNHAIRPDRPKCAHCNSDNVVKNGHKDGLQRYMCKDCGKTFAITNNTILFSSKKSVDVWQKFCECIMNKCSIRKSAEICDINTHTAFNWRHKILDALQNMQDEVVLSGVIESDETFCPVKRINADIPLLHGDCQKKWFVFHVL